MKHSLFWAVFLITFVFDLASVAQKKSFSSNKISKKSASASLSARETSNTAVVVDERLAVLRATPSLFAMPIQRMRTGRLVLISGSKESDGVTFYRVSVPPNNFGWVQADAVFGKHRRGDDERLAKLVQATDGFEQIERAALFVENYPNSTLRPAILLLLGDLIEENSGKLSQDATKKLDRREMAATGAPLHSFYLNYPSLDRYRKLGIDFLFNSSTKTFHYDGASWKEIMQKFPKSSEAAEAKKRMDLLKVKMERTK